MAKQTPKQTPANPDLSSCCRLHLRFGWGTLLVFLAGGLILEVLHGLKVGFYVDAASTTRRLMWTLAHTHGALLGLIHVAFGTTLHRMPAWDPRSRALASRCLIGAGILLPMGFFLGGLFTYAGDPGLGILLTPPGALLLFLAVWLTFRGAGTI